MRSFYDYLIVGSGLAGSVFAERMSNRGKTSLIVEKRNHVGGNCYSEHKNGICIHKYGPHIFHTDKKFIWDYVNSFSFFSPFVLRVKANINGIIYPMPVNLLTLSMIWGVSNPQSAFDRLLKERVRISNPKNAEEWLFSKIGKELTNLFYRYYSEKHWGEPLSELPESICKRLPVRLNFDDNYFDHQYQGIPVDGYDSFFNKLLLNDKIDVILNEDYFNKRTYWDSLAKKIIFTGPIDAFYNYKYGRLDYISIDIVEEWLNTSDFQGCPVMTYPTNNVPFTRSIEHKHFEPFKNTNEDMTVVTREYPKRGSGLEPFYPLGNAKNIERYKKYSEEAKKQSSIIFLGRLAEYRYYDMHHVIESSLIASEKEL